MMVMNKNIFLKQVYLAGSMSVLRKVKCNSREVERFFDTLMKYKTEPDESSTRMISIVKNKCPELFVRETSETKRNIRICDVGCGDGSVLRDIQTTSPHDLQLEGVDISGRAIDYCREHSNGDLVFHHADICPFELHDQETLFDKDTVEHCKPELNPEAILHWGTFDYVLSLDTMFLMPDVYEAMSQHCRLLSEGGKLIICLSVFTESNSTLENLTNHKGVSEKFIQEYLSIHTWKSIIRGAGLHLDDVAIKVISGNEYLTFITSLKPVTPIPTPSDTLGKNYPSARPLNSILTA